MIFVILWTRATKDKWLVAAALRSGVFVGSVVGSKFLFGYLLAGERALSLFGLYGTLESISQGAADKVATSVTGNSEVSVFFTGWGQTLMVTMIIGFALAVAIHGLILGFKKNSELFEQIKFRVLIGIALLNMMGAIAMFEALINFDVWMHTRYYTYLIPLGLIVLVEALRNSERLVWPWAKNIVFAIFFGLGVYNLITNAAPYSSNWIDAPDFRALIDNLATAQLTIVIGMIASVVWLRKSKPAVAIALALAVFSSVFSGVHNSNFLRATFGEETAYEHLARVIRDFLPQDEADRLVAVGQVEMLQRTLFSSLTGSAYIQSPPIDRATLDPTRSWLLTIGEPVLTGFEDPTIKNFGYSLYSLDSSNKLTPRNNRVLSFSGACPQVTDKDWACGTETKVFLDRSFPTNANVDLIFELSQEAASAEIELILGDAAISGSLSAGLNSMNVKFTNTTPQESLMIKVKNPSGIGLTGESKFVRIVWGLAGN